MLSVLEILQKTTGFLASRGIEQARLNAELLIGQALGLKRMDLYLQFERLLPETELEKIRPLVRRRGQREPLQYILGEVDFCGLKLAVDRRALIPRPETEFLVERVRERLPAGPHRILDLGTGTGAIALALANAYPEARVLATDASEAALALARENAQRVGLAGRVEFRWSSWYASLADEAGFDVIVSNPPYLSAAEVAALAPEVREFEPHSALAAAEDGQADLRAIIAGAPRHLAAQGWLALETGEAQHEQLVPRLQAAGLARVESLKDLAGRERYLLAQAAGAVPA